MRASPTCPFCSSHFVATTAETELLRHQQCTQCGKRWAEANVPPRIDDGIQRAAAPAEATDRPHPLPKWSPS